MESTRTKGQAEEVEPLGRGERLEKAHGRGLERSRTEARGDQRGTLASETARLEDLWRKKEDDDQCGLKNRESEVPRGRARQQENAVEVELRREELDQRVLAWVKWNMESGGMSQRQLSAMEDGTSAWIIWAWAKWRKEVDEKL